MGKYFNHRNFNERRKMLRGNLPQPERILWWHLRNNQTGFRFRRQFGIGPYVVDFYCPKKRLVIEIDGDSHFTTDAIEYDKQRETYLKTCRTSILRFSNADVMHDIRGVFERIIEKMTQTPCGPPL